MAEDDLGSFDEQGVDADENDPRMARSGVPVLVGEVGIVREEEARFSLRLSGERGIGRPLQDGPDIMAE